MKYVLVYIVVFCVFFFNFAKLRKYAWFSVYYITLKIKCFVIVVLTKYVQIVLLKYLAYCLLNSSDIQYQTSWGLPTFVIEYNCVMAALKNDIVTKVLYVSLILLCKSVSINYGNLFFYSYLGNSDWYMAINSNNYLTIWPKTTSLFYFCVLILNW